MLQLKRIIIITVMTSLIYTNKTAPIKLGSANAIHTVLPNGMTVIVKEDHSNPVTAVHIRIRAGSVTEVDYFGCGLSHFFEHSLFLGSKDHPEADSYSAEIESYGGANVNAYTTFNHTAYYFTVLSKYTRESINCIEDLVFNPLFPEQEVKNEKGSILSEMNMRDDNINSYFQKVISSLCFKNLPYKFPVIGYKEKFKQLSTSELLDYYKAMYVPNNTILSVVGDFDSKSVLKHIKQRFKKYKKYKIKKPCFNEDPPWQYEIAEETHPNAEYTRIAFLWQTVSYFDQNMYPLDVLSSFLADGEGSILHNILKEKLSLIEEISSFSWTPRYKGVFDITIDLPADKNKKEIIEIISKVKQTIFKSLKDIKAGNINDYQLESVKREVLADFINSKETAMGEASSLAASVMTSGGLNYDTLYLKGIQAVNKRQIREVSKKYLKKTNMKIAVITPPAIGKKEKLFPEAKSLAELRTDNIDFHYKKEQRQIKGAAKDRLPYDQALLQTEKQDNKTVKNNVKKIVLKNNLKILYEKNRKLPKIVLVISALGGLAHEKGDIKNGSFSLLSEMLLTGNEKYSKQELIKFLKLHGINIVPFAGKNSFGLKISFLKDKLPETAAVLKAILTNPSFNRKDFNKEIKNRLFLLQHKNENGWYVSGVQFKKYFFADTVFANPVEGTPESIKEIKLRDIELLKDRFLIPANMVVAIYGNILQQENKKYFIPLLEKMHGNKSIISQKISLHPLTFRGKKDIHKETNNFKQTYIRMGFRAPVINSSDFPAFQVVNGHLSGMGGPLFKLRSKSYTNAAGKVQGGRAYQLGAFYDSSRDYGALVFYAALRYGARDQYQWALDAFLKNALKLKEDKISLTELNRAKSSIIGSEIINSQRLLGKALNETLYELYGYGYENYRNQLNKIDKISRKEVRKTARKYLADDNFTIYIMLAK